MRINRVVQEARYRRRTPVIYPSRAVELGQQGMVTLHALISLDGLPKKMRVVISSGSKILDFAAMAAVQKWQFHPAHQNGRATVGWVRVPVHFVIQ